MVCFNRLNYFSKKKLPPSVRNADPYYATRHCYDARHSYTNALEEAKPWGSSKGIRFQI